MFLSGKNELRLNRETVTLAIQQWVDRNVSPDVPVKVDGLHYLAPWFVLTAEPLAEVTAKRIGAAQ